MSLRKLKVTVVTDQRKMLRHVSQLLAALGYDVRSVADPAQALALLETGDTDFLIVDSEPSIARAIHWCREACRHDRPRYFYSLLMVENPQPTELKEALEAGIDDFLCKPVRHVEVLVRLRAGARVLEFERRLREQSGLDVLTPLMHRQAFVDCLGKQGTTRGGQDPGACILIDVDFLGEINQQYGRPGGDAVILAAAETLRKQCGEDALLASFGGGRFAVLLSAVSEAEACRWAESARTALAETEIPLASARVRVTASLGVVALPAGECAAEEILQRATQALRAAKISGRNSVTRFGEHDAESKEWGDLVASGKMFEQVVARDIMTPCTLLLHMDHALRRAAALIRQTGLPAMPVVDANGKLVGLVTEKEVSSAAARDEHAPLRVRDVMVTDLAVLDEDAGFAAVRETLTSGARSLVVIVCNDKPTGVVTSDSLASLGVRLSAESFSPTEPWSASSRYLIVPDLCPLGDGA
jgi:two-component system cell cycle response regulator